MTDRAHEVTVVVPTKDRAHLLPVTLGAILAQEGVALRVVVVDDGSTDDTRGAIATLGDERVDVVRHQVPQRLPAARNAGLAAATSPWVAFCDDDDLWAPSKLRRQLDALAAMPDARWACGGAVLVDEHLAVFGHLPAPPSGDILPLLLRGNVVPGGGSGVLVDRSLLVDLGGFDPAMHSSEDWECWIRLARRSPVASVDAPLLAYRVWPGSMSTNVERMRASRVEIGRRTVEDAQRLGVAQDERDHERYLASQLLRGPDGRQAARVHARLAVRHRRLDDLLRAGAALAAPAVLARRGTRRGLARVPAAWTEEAGAWLGAIRPQVAAMVHQ